MSLIEQAVELIQRASAQQPVGRLVKRREESVAVEVPNEVSAVPVSYTHLTLPTNREV